MITDAMWDLLEPMVRAKGLSRCGDKPKVPDRQFLEGLLYLARCGLPWRDLPGEFGAWDAAYNRFRRWVARGRLDALLAAATENPDLGELPRLLIDSTIVRAHAHASGAPRKKSASGRSARPKSKGSAAAAAGSRARSSPSRPTRTR